MTDGRWSVGIACSPAGDEEVILYDGQPVSVWDVVEALNCKDETAGEKDETIGIDGKPWPATMDADAWAKEFCKRNSASDQGTMLGWFSNAIMCGWDTAHHHDNRLASAVRLLEDYDMLEEAERLQKRAARADRGDL